MTITEEDFEWLKEDINNLKEAVVLLTKQFSFREHDRQKFRDLIEKLEAQYTAYRVELSKSKKNYGGNKNGN